MTEFRELIPYESCPLCGGSRIEPTVRADCSAHPAFAEPLSRTMEWMRCADCGHVFRNGFYTPEAFEILFRSSLAGQRVGEDYERQRNIAAAMIERILPLRKTGIWLDVGFGNASLLLTAAEFGFAPVGFDLRQRNVDALRALGIQALKADITEATLNPKASVISMCDVLEHTRFPIPVLQAAHRNLLPGGALLLSMPNLDSPLWKMLDRDGINPYWSEMEHFHNFSRASIHRLLESCGFSPVRYGISERYRACMEIVASRGTNGGGVPRDPEKPA
jgi:SAM-dependent methyltransferase